MTDKAGTSIGRMLRTALSWLRHRASKLSRPFGFNRFRGLPRGWRYIGSETAVRATRQSFAVEETPAELIEALNQSDYSHLPSMKEEK